MGCYAPLFYRCCPHYGFDHSIIPFAIDGGFLFSGGNMCITNYIHRLTPAEKNKLNLYIRQSTQHLKRHLSNVIVDGSTLDDRGIDRMIIWRALKYAVFSI